MPRDFFSRDPFAKRRPFFPKRKPRPAAAQGSGRYDLPPDGPLEVPAVELDRPLELDAALADRLRRREVNAKEAFTVRDASGACYRAALQELSASGGRALPYERMPVSPEPTVEITLACAVLARQRMIFVAQKATELGVSRLVPLLTEKSVPAGGLAHEKAHAWPGQILRAAKQCRRSSLPELLPPTPFDAFLEHPASRGDVALCLDNVAGTADAPAGGHRRIVLWVGPEGGFSDAERRKLEGRAIPWLLGGRVLRAETAVLVGLAAVHLRWGDFR